MSYFNSCNVHWLRNSEVGVKYHVHAKEHEETMMYQLFKVVPNLQNSNYEVLKK